MPHLFADCLCVRWQGNLSNMLRPLDFSSKRMLCYAALALHSTLIEYSIHRSTHVLLGLLSNRSNDVILSSMDAAKYEDIKRAQK